MEITLAGLEAFVEVAERKSIRAAADALGYTPSAISQRLSALEKALDLQLFERLGNSIAVSSDAERLRGSAVAALQSVSELRRVAGEAASGQGVRHRVRLGGFPSGVQMFVPGVFSELRDAGVDLEVVSVASQAGEAELRLGHIDLLLMQEYNVQKQRRDEFDYQQLACEQLVLLYVGEGRDLGIKDMADASWIVSGAESSCGIGVRDLCHLAGFEPRVVCVVDDFGVQQQLVASGVGVAVMPRSCIANGSLWSTFNVDDHVAESGERAAYGRISSTGLDAVRTVTALRRRTSLGDLTLEFVLENLRAVGEDCVRVVP